MPSRLAVLLLVGLALAPARAQDPAASPAPGDPRVTNVILFIGDGLGPAGVTLARTFRSPLALDSVLVGSLATASANAAITDSAASATAMACGVATNNGMVAVTPDGKPAVTILEGAKARGLATGVVVTSRLTHATPACFTAHVASRGEEEEIGRQQLEQGGFDLLMGGGRRWYQAPAQGGLREDGRDLLAEASQRGVQVIGTRAELLGDLSLPVIGLFAPDHMSYEIDRDAAVQPSLAEMTRRALELLSQHEAGFVLMVEGSRIDHAEHNHDLGGLLHDVLAYDAAVGVALDFARRDGHTLVIATADHETGGLSLGADVPGTSHGYGWNPAPLRRVRASNEALKEALKDHDALEVARDLLGIETLSGAERTALAEVQAKHGPSGVVGLLCRLLSERCRLGWTTRGHTAVDVGLYAFGPGSERLIGHHPVTWIGRVVAELRGLELGAAR